MKRPLPPRRDRRTPLPSQHPKTGEDDLQAPERVARLLADPAYREADEDAALLQRDELRGVRLLLDYWKVEEALQRAGVDRTIVVFGSTRIAEPAAAQRRVEAARAEAAAHPDDATRARALRIAERVADNSRYYGVAREFGRRVGATGGGPWGQRRVVMTGGGPGLMEAANRGAFDAGAPTVGLNIRLPHPQYPNPYLTPGLCFLLHYFAIRKLHFMKRADALVVFPGGYGTLDELFETLALVQTRTIAPVPIVLVGERFWRRAFDVEFLVDEGVIDPEDAELFWFAETADEVWNGIEAWHAARAHADSADGRAGPAA